jgi:hypothetical protein
MKAIEEYLFSFWQLVNGHDGFKPVMGIIFGVVAIYVVQSCIRLPAEPTRPSGGLSTPIVEWRKRKRNLKALAAAIVLVNLATVGLYLRVWVFMQGKPAEFPAGHHLPLIWGSCLLGVLLLVVLAAIYLGFENAIKPSK